jgi:hypothetical protein
LKEVRALLAREQLGNVPLIGSSVAVCLFGERPHEQGALLIALASRRLLAATAICSNAEDDPACTASTLLHDLKATDPAAQPHNRFLMLFLPGERDDKGIAHNRGGEIVDELRSQTLGSLHMFGGVSSVGLRAGRGSQFCDDNVLQGSAVAALVTTDLSYGAGIAAGLEPVDLPLLHVKDVSDDGRQIRCFREDRPDRALWGINGPLVFTVNSTEQRDVVVAAHLKDNSTTRAGTSSKLAQPRSGNGERTEAIIPPT